MKDQLNQVTLSNDDEASDVFSPGVPIEKALEKLRLRLLDLTGRNRLINFTHKPNRSLQFIHSTIDGSVARLLDLPLIYDADSSQHSALIDVVEGKNRVIEGPPGTGKSQTITNMIAVALHEGKKILFMAEKLAALSVVKSRLTQAGLDAFILELHSNKTNKKRVLEELESRIKLRVPKDADLPAKLASLEEKRSELKAYADLLNSHIGNLLDLTIHQVIWRAERHRLQADESAYAVQSIDYFSPQNVTKDQFTRRTQALGYLAKQHEQIGGYNSTHPMWGFFVEELSPEGDIDLRRNLREYEEKFFAFENAAERTHELLQDGDMALDSKGASTLLNLLTNIAPSDAGDIDFDLLPTLFSKFGTDGATSLAILKRIDECITRIGELESIVAKSLVAPGLASDADIAKANEYEESLRELGLADSARNELEECDKVSKQTIAQADEAIRRLKEVADFIEFQFDAKLRDSRKLQILVEIALAAPIDLLRLRHSGLANPDAVHKLQDAIRQVSQIAKLQATAENVLYVERAPDDNQVFSAIQKLREGGRWYRIFQGEWRRAINLHKSISKSTAKQDWKARLTELELLLSLSTAKNKLAADAKVKSISGSHFDDERTPFQELHALASWIGESDAKLDGAGIDLATMSTVSIRRATIEELRARATTVNESLAHLAMLDQVAKEHFSTAAPKRQTEFGTQSWTEKIAALTSIQKTLSSAIAFHSLLGLPNISAAGLSKALRATKDLSDTNARLQNDREARTLLGEKFNGCDTQLEPIFAAHTYGALVKSAKVPAAVERLLIANNAVENHELLAGLTSEINIGWSNAAEFARAMTNLGRFELASWVEAAPSDVKSYSKALAEKGRRAVENLATLLPWAQYGHARRAAKDQGLGDFVQAFETGSIKAPHLEHAFAYRFYAAIAKGVFEQYPPLRHFSGVKHSTVRSEFADLDKEIIRLRGAQIAARCKKQANPPRGSHGARVDDKTEMNLLEHLIPQQRPRFPVRKIMQRAGRAIQELKPCFMMGPQAVAQFLEPGAMHFDIIVMDEASQLRPEQAIGAIARGTQLIVVGDPKQLPPTNFFGGRNASDGEDEEGIGQLATTESESILDACMSHFQPVRSLRWHYRSKHESLIAFSNQNFYRGNLVVFPSPHAKSKELGLTYVYVQDGIYEGQMNVIEARRVVDAVVEHILTRPNDSVGVVTLNVKQRDLISELLEQRLHNIPQATAFQERCKVEGMELFVKNLENVQGDERDSIIVSTTFGRPPESDVVRQNFGPISKEGGWRRLNVLFTRARKSVLVFSSMRPEDIVSDNKTPKGTRALRDYLEFARTGVVPSESETNLPPDSDFEVAVIDVLEKHGFEVTPQLGVAGFRLDLAVKNPNNLSGYLAAIECDGAAYHSGVSVRDRDRIRQEILEGLGWKGKIWRIWSTDWFRNPMAETEKLLSFLNALKEDVSHIHAPNIVSDVAVEESPQLGEMEVRTRESEIVESLVFDVEEDDIEVEVGDLVTYHPLHHPDEETLVRVTNIHKQFEQGVVPQSTPLGAVLMGATVGETIVLRVPGKEPLSLVIKAIKRVHE